MLVVGDVRRGLRGDLEGRRSGTERSSSAGAPSAIRVSPSYSATVPSASRRTSSGVSRGGGARSETAALAESIRSATRPHA